MTAFSTFRNIKATRKAHTCETCRRPIDIGSPAAYWAGDCDGYLYSCHWHVECRAAEVAINEKNDSWGDEYCGVDQHLEGPEDLAWLIENHPICATRMGVLQ